MGFLTCRALRTPGRVCLRSPAAGGGPAGGGGSGDSGCAAVSAGSLESVDSEAFSPSWRPYHSRAAWIEKSKYSVIKEEFGDMQSFMETCHLKQSEDGFREANAFVDVLSGLDRDRWLREHQRCHLALSDLPSDETLLMCLACL